MFFAQYSPYLQCSPSLSTENMRPAEHRKHAAGRENTYLRRGNTGKSIFFSFWARKLKFGMQVTFHETNWIFETKSKNKPLGLCYRRPSWIFDEKSANFNFLLLFCFPTIYFEILQKCTVGVVSQNSLFGFSFFSIFVFSKIFENQGEKIPQKSIFWSLFKSFFQI